VVSQVLHEHAATLSAAGPTIRSRRLIKCAKDSGQDLQPPEKAARMDAVLRRVVASRRPLLSRLPAQTSRPPPFLTRLFLPLGNDGKTVDMILVVREPTSTSLAGPYL